MNKGNKNSPKGKKKSDRKFDWGMIQTDMGQFLAVDGSYAEAKAIEFFKRFRPQDDPYSIIDTGFISYDVSKNIYKVVDEGAPGAFKVYLFYMD